MATSPPPGLHADLLDKLGRRLADGELAEGAVLRAEELAARFDVSRTVVREAVRVLESMGMVTSRRRVGLTVAPRTSWNVYDPLIIRWRLAGRDREAQLRSLSELRAGVEPVAAWFAAERATPEQCGVMTGAVMDMAVHSRSGDLQAYLAADILFHRTLLGLIPSTPNPAAVRLHADVAQAVQARSASAAHRAMTEIISEAAEYML